MYDAIHRARPRRSGRINTFHITSISLWWIIVSGRNSRRLQKTEGSSSCEKNSVASRAWLEATSRRASPQSRPSGNTASARARLRCGSARGAAHGARTRKHALQARRRRWIDGKGLWEERDRQTSGDRWMVGKRKRRKRGGKKNSWEGNVKRERKKMRKRKNKRNAGLTSLCHFLPTFSFLQFKGRLSLLQRLLDIRPVESLIKSELTFHDSLWICLSLAPSASGSETPLFSESLSYPTKYILKIGWKYRENIRIHKYYFFLFFDIIVFFSSIYSTT